MPTRNRILGIIPRILLSAFAGGFAFLFITLMNCPKFVENLVGDPTNVLIGGGVLTMTAVILQKAFGRNIEESEAGAIELFMALLTAMAIIIVMAKCP